MAVLQEQEDAKARYVIGRSLDCDLMVPSPRMSARHAEVVVQGHAAWIRDLGSRYGTLVNNQPVHDWASFGPLDRVTVGGSNLVLAAGGTLEITAAQSGATVCAAGLGVAVNKGRKQLLRNLSFVVHPGELVALMGLSGAGKSTLLKTLVGLITPSWGAVMINGVDLAQDASRARLNVGYVPQDDIVHADLTVQEALRHGAALRLPVDTGAAEIESRIAVLLNNLEIGHIADTIIGSSERAGISGGQRKRVNLALELLSQPPLLLLDEPTSGLSSEDAANVFSLLRQLADEGHTIIVTTHQPSLADFQCFDRAIYLTDGELVYFGPAWPDSARFFEPVVGAAGAGGAAPGAAADADPSGAPGGGASTSRGAVAEKPLDAGAALARLTELKRQGVKARTLAETYERSEYFSEFVARRLGALDVAGARQRRAPRLAGLASPRQFLNQLTRYARLKVRNRGSLPIQLAQAPIVAVLVNLIFKHGTAAEQSARLSSILYFLMVASVWFGCSNAAREIVGERPILMRERMVGLGVGSYVLSKLGVLGALAAVQCLLLLGITAVWQPPALEGGFLREVSILWVAAMLGALMGLALSATARSSEAALSATPLLLIPEILLSGFIVPLNELPTPVRWLSNLVTSRWGFEALLNVEGLHAQAAHAFGEFAVGARTAVGGLAGLGVLYATCLWCALAGNPRKFA